MHPGMDVAKLANRFAGFDPNLKQKHSVKQMAFLVVQLSEFGCIWVRCLCMEVDA